MNNNIERNIREKYIENLLKNSQDWDWYINYLEENFDINYEVNSLDDFKKCYVDISEAFDSIIRINRSVEKELPISKLWLKTLNEISLFYLGKIDFSEIALYDAFFKTLALLVYTAKIYNDTTHGELLWYSDIFQYNNLYKLFSMDLFITNADIIISGLDQIGYITDSEKEVFQNNINEVFVPCNSFLDEYRSSIVCADCFNFRSIDGAKCSTWEEKYLHDMLQTEYLNGKLNPQIGYKNGHTFPDFSVWTTPALEIMKYDLHDEDATFIIESVEYALYNTVISACC